MQFLRIGDTLVNLDRLLAVQHKPEVPGVIRTKEHYRAYFDTGQEIWLTPAEGEQVVAYCKFRVGINPEDGNTATTSEAAT